MLIAKSPIKKPHNVFKDKSKLLYLIYIRVDEPPYKIERHEPEMDFSTWVVMMEKVVTEATT